MMNRSTLISRFHGALDSPSAPTWRASGWGSRESQEARFAALLRCTGFTHGTVLDYGCGTGDLFRYLSESEYTFTYLGVDLRPHAIELAIKRHGNHFKLIEMDSMSFERTQYIFASGVFQFVDSDDPLYYQRMLANLFDRCDIALGANFLSDLRDPTQMTNDELYMDSASIATLGSSLSKFWILDHSYHPGGGDFTLGLHRRKVTSAWQNLQIGNPERAT